MNRTLIVIGLLASSVLCCPDKDPYCAFCNGPVCIYCVASFPGPQGRCIESSLKVDNCIAYAANGVCRSCVFGFSLQNNRCVKISIPNCYEANNGVCSFCQNRVLQTNGNCNSSRKCSDPNCTLCKIDNGNEVCGLCQPGWAIQVTAGNRYRCVQEYGNSVNCLRVFNEDKGRCAVCDLNYYWRNAACVKTRAYAPIDYLPKAASSRWFSW
jgi:hypothetical protein